MPSKKNDWPWPNTLQTAAFLCCSFIAPMLSVQGLAPSTLNPDSSLSRWPGPSSDDWDGPSTLGGQVRHLLKLYRSPIMACLDLMLRYLVVAELF